MTHPLTPREKVEQAVKDAIREDASVGLQMTLTPRFMRGLVDRVLAATSVVDHETGLVSDKSAALRAQPPAREEAPAGEAMDAGFEAWLNERNLLPHGAWDWPSIVAMLNHHEDALRARSSAPEALGNLLAVIHGDGGHRALEVGTKQAALEAEKIVAGLFAAPSADKLRELVGASEDILSALSKLSVAGKPIASLDTKLRDAINTLVPALAALQAEQKGGA